MSVVINTNLSSLNAQHHLNKTTATLSKSYERLSDGLQINQTADDASGQAVAARMTAQTGKMHKTLDNTNDGISLFQSPKETSNNNIATMLQKPAIPSNMVDTAREDRKAVRDAQSHKATNEESETSSSGGRIGVDVTA